MGYLGGWFHRFIVFNVLVGWNKTEMESSRGYQKHELLSYIQNIRILELLESFPLLLLLLRHLLLLLSARLRQQVVQRISILITSSQHVSSNLICMEGSNSQSCDLILHTLETPNDPSHLALHLSAVIHDPSAMALKDRLDPNETKLDVGTLLHEARHEA